MTNQEFSIEFDILYNNINSNQAAGLSAYEKSVFLTEAQEALIKDIYSGRLAKSFEETEEMRSYLSNLIDTRSYKEGRAYTELLTPNSKVFDLDTDIWFKTAEKVILNDSKLSCGSSTKSEASVLPVTQDALDKIINNPFRGPSRHRVLRLDLSNSSVELVSKFNIESYVVRFLRRPRPIILEDLPQGLSINNYSEETSCELSDSIHRDILVRAVDLAKTVWKN